MLGGDHYKWRAMLSNGADTSLLYGDKGTAPDFERFEAYASMLKYAVGNPLFHWTHLELKRVFGIDEVLTDKTVRGIYDRCNELLAGDDFRCRRLIEKYSTGTIVLSGLIRLAFSTTPSAKLPKLFANVAAAVADLTK